MLLTAGGCILLAQRAGRVKIRMRCGFRARRLGAMPSDEELKHALVTRSWAEQEAIVAADNAVRSRPELVEELKTSQRPDTCR